MTKDTYIREFALDVLAVVEGYLLLFGGVCAYTTPDRDWFFVEGELVARLGWSVEKPYKGVKWTESWLCVVGDTISERSVSETSARFVVAVLFLGSPPVAAPACVARATGGFRMAVSK